MTDDVVTYSRDGEWLAPGLLRLCERERARRQRDEELRVLRDLRLVLELLSTRGRHWRLDQLLEDVAVLIEERESQR